jgi:hypothetical protein
MQLLTYCLTKLVHFHFYHCKNIRCKVQLMELFIVWSSLPSCQNVNLVPVHNVKACRGIRGTSPLVINLSARRRWVANFASRSLYPPKRNPVQIGGSFTPLKETRYKLAVASPPPKRNPVQIDGSFTPLKETRYKLAVALPPWKHPGTNWRSLNAPKRTPVQIGRRLGGHNGRFGLLQKRQVS